MKWETVEIGQLGDVVTGNTPPRKNPELYGDFIPFIKPTDMELDRRYTPNPEECYSELGFEKYRKSLIPKGATCVVTIGSIGKKMTQAHTDCFINQAVNAVIPNDEFDPDFVFYLLKNNLHKVKGLDSGTSSGRENVSKSSFSSIEVKVIKHLPTQRKIASILSRYDDLIENNLRRVRLLEEKAFLRYRGIVQGEEMETFKLNEVTQVLKRGVSPKYVEDDGIVVLNQKCIRNHIVSFEDSRLTDSETKISADRMLQKFDTLVNSTGMGTLGRIAMNIQEDFPLTVDSHVSIVRANEKISPIFLFESLLAQEHVIASMGEGSTNQTELSARKFGEEIKIKVPSKSAMFDFEREAEPIFNLIRNLQKQNTKLREARDILLPRLMSGEVEV